MYLVFEGFDGSGKSSVVHKLMEELSLRGVFNFKLVNYMAPVPMWISMGNLIDQISNNLSAHTENAIRSFRYEMQFKHFIRPLLELGINVFGDRGPASLAYRNGYRLGTLPDSYLEMISLPDLYFVIETTPIKCYERITSTRKLNRVERKFRYSTDRQEEMNDFLSDYDEYNLFLEGVLPKDRTFHIDNNQPIDQTVANLMELIQNILYTGEDFRLHKSENLARKISLSKKAITSQYLLADLIRNSENDLAIKPTISEIIVKLDKLKDGSPSKLEDYLATIIESKRTDVKEVVVSLVDEAPYLCRVVASVISKNVAIMTRDLLKKILIDEKARSIFICQMGTNMIELPPFEELFNLLASELSTNIAYSLTLYVKGIERQKFELLSRGSLLFNADPFVSFFAVQAWISAGLMEYLPPSFKEHNVLEIMHLLEVHDFEEKSENLLAASRINNLFIFSSKHNIHSSYNEGILNFLASNYEWVDIVIQVNEKFNPIEHRIFFRNERNSWIEKCFEYSLIDLSRPCVIVGDKDAIDDFISSIGE